MLGLIVTVKDTDLVLLNKMFLRKWMQADVRSNLYLVFTFVL